MFGYLIQMPQCAGKPDYEKNRDDVLLCLESHVRAQLHSRSFLTIIHAGNSAYLRFLHFLISQLLLSKRRVYVFDYNRRIKQVYLQQLIHQASTRPQEAMKFLHLSVILDEDHALNELVRLQRRKASKRQSPVLMMIDPSGLFRRIRGGVKQSAKTLQFQYEAAALFLQLGYAVVVSDSGGRQFHRIESLVPRQLATPATLILQFLPRQIILS